MRYALLLLCSMVSVMVSAAESVDDDALIAQAEKIVNEEKPAANAVKAKASAEAKAEAGSPIKGDAKPESDLPVFLDNKKTEVTAGSTILRLGLSLALLAVIAGVMIFASKRWPKKGSVGGKGTRIDILHQLHVGPRRNLTLIRVAGEVMLLGMTDHSVNLIKTVTLIDDELETLAGQDFNNFLEDEFSVEDVRSVIRTRA